MLPPGEQPSEPGFLGEGKGRVYRLLVGYPASTMRDSHTIGFVPVCRVTASTMQEGETLCKASMCLEARALGGFSPQKERKGLVQ